MHKKIGLLFLAAGIAVMSSAAMSQDQAQQQDQVRQQDQQRIYGSQLMTPEERNAYRAKMRSAKTQEEREKIRAEHHEQMKARAKERGIALPDEPPMKGGGMGRGGGMMAPGGGGMGSGGMGGGRGGY
ncbi:MAG: hypothetical protein ACM3JK_07280 [Betaproteobacteria bacterium]